MLRYCFQLFSLGLTFHTAWAQPQDANSLLLENATIVDPSKQSVGSGHIHVADGRIAAVLDSVPEGFEGRRMDLEGKWVIPGLVDMHTHSFGNASPKGFNQSQILQTPGTAKVMLYSGVTAFLDLFNLEPIILQIRNNQRAGKVPGADIFASGPCLTATGGHCSEYGIPTRIINNPEEAAQQIGELAEKKPDVVKIVYDNFPGRLPTIDLETLKAAVAAAEEHGLKTVIHIGTWQDVRDSVEAGASAVTHTPNGPVPEGLSELMREKGTAIIPTLAVQSEFSRLLDSPQGLARPLLKSVAPRKLLKDYEGDITNERSKRWLAFQRKNRHTYLEAVAELAAAGVTIMAGTDAGNIGVFQGYSLHRELELLVEAGLSPWQALQAATSNPAKFLGQPWGVQPGSQANLVVLSASPIEDISNTQQIEAVIHHGRPIDRQTLVSTN